MSKIEHIAIYADDPTAVIAGALVPSGTACSRRTSMSAIR